MDEPRRLREEPGSGELERALLRAGSSYRSSDATRVRTLAALGLAGAIAGVASSASASMLAKSSWLKFIAIGAIGAAVAIPVLRAAQSEVPAQKERSPSLTLSKQPSVMTLTEPDSGPVEDPGEAAPAAHPSPLASQATRPKARPLGSELAMLDAARVAVARGEAKRALRLLEGYAKDYPRGKMQVEAEVLRIDAYAKSGQKERARKRAQAFLKSRPNSVFAARVQSYL